MLKVIRITLEQEYSFVLCYFTEFELVFAQWVMISIVFFCLLFLYLLMIIAGYPINKSMLKVIRITLEQEYSFVLMLLYWIWTGFCTMSTDFYCFFVVVMFYIWVIIARYPINKSMLKVIRITLEQEYSFVLMLLYWIWTGFCTMKYWFLLYFFCCYFYIWGDHS